MPKNNEVLKTWDSYVKEATKATLKIKVSDDKDITIPQPTGSTLLDAEDLMRAGATGRDQLANICGDAFDDLIPLIEQAPAGAVSALLADIMAHYGVELGEG